MTSKRRPRRPPEDPPRPATENQNAAGDPPAAPPPDEAQWPRPVWVLVTPSRPVPAPSRRRGKVRKKRPPSITAVRRHAQACRNELRSLFLGITDGTPEFVPALATVYGRAPNDAALLASLRDLRARGRKLLGSRDVLVMERCRRMHLEPALLDQAKALAAELRRALHG